MAGAWGVRVSSCRHWMDIIWKSRSRQCDSCFVKLYKQIHSLPCLHCFEFLSLAPEIILINTQCAGHCCRWFLEAATFNDVYLILLIFFSMYLSSMPLMLFLWLIFVSRHWLSVTVSENPPAHPIPHSPPLLFMITLKPMANSGDIVDIMMRLQGWFIGEENAPLGIGFFVV